MEIASFVGMLNIAKKDIMAIRNTARNALVSKSVVISGAKEQHITTNIVPSLSTTNS